MINWKRSDKKVKEKTQSIQLLMIISFLLTLLLTVITIAVFIYMNWRKSINSYIDEMENRVSNEIVAEIDNLVQIPLSINERISFLIENGIIDIRDENNRDPFLANLVKTSDDAVYSISYGTEAGEYYGARRNSLNEIEVYKSNDETEGHSFYYSVNKDLTKGSFVYDAGLFDPRSREWYIAAKELGSPTFSPLYKHFVKEDLVLSASYPIYNKSGQLEGVLGSHITLRRLNNFLKEISSTNKGSAYILELDTDNLVANSLEMSNFNVLTDGSYSRINADEITGSALNKSLFEYKQNGNDKIVTSMDNEKFYVNFTDYHKNGLNWMIITILPESVFIADIERNYKSAAVMLILFIFASILLLIKIMQNILRPVHELIKVTDQFSKGDLSKRADIHRNDEIGKLSKSFNHMADELHLHINHLESLVKERTEEIEKTLLELRKSNEEKQLLLDSTAEGIFGLDLNDKCTFINASSLRMLGYHSQDELIGEGLHWIIHYEHSDGTHYPLKDCRIYSAVFDGKYIHEDKEIFWKADGTSFPVEYYAYPQYQNGLLIGAVVTFNDITERLHAQNALIEAKEQAEAANITKSQFLANMSHEIRTPMNGIVGFLQILECSELNKNQMEYIRMIKSSTDSLLNIINDILDISKIEAGMLQLEKISFDMHSMIEMAVSLFHVKAYEKDLELNMLISPVIPRFLIGDPTRLRQVLVNLVSNAIKFTDKGSIFIEVTLCSEDDREIEVLFCVKDSGIGIDPDNQNKLFLPFSQLDTSTTRKYGGTGLGLVICKKLVEQMNGQIGVTSEKGKGSVFYYKVKLLKTEDEGIREAQDVFLLNKKNMMIVDESSMSRHIIKVYLEQFGCKVSESSSVEEALLTISEESGKRPYHAILIDEKLEKSIISLVTIIQLYQPDTECNLIRITSLLPSGETNQALSKEYSGTITKPYRKADVMKCIVELFGKENNKKEYSIIDTDTKWKKEEPISELKILLAEDQVMNQKFFTTFLNMEGLTCDVVMNGQEAVNACLEKDYDIIFMDCQMPVLDGFQATRKIREVQGNEKHSVIIAMTAYAMSGDKEKCLKVGMDDYLSKPINVEQVLAKLRIYERNRNILSEKGSNDKEDSYFELTVKALIRESGFDRSIAEEFLREFHDHSLELLDEMKNQIELNNLNDAKICVHKLKGIAGNLRVKKIAEYAADVEMELKNGADRSKIRNLMNKIHRLIDELEI